MLGKSVLKRLLGYQPPPRNLVGTEALYRDWTFQPSRAGVLSRLERARARRHLIVAPPSATLVAVEPRKRWTLYFIYAPQGVLSAAHRFSLQRLRTSDTALAVVCASPSIETVPAELLDDTDALFWKGLSGFDFSAYAIGLHALASYSPGADILVMNDSVFGPFEPLDDLFKRCLWDLTGFTASGDIENHLQSYALMLRNWTPQKAAALRDVAPCTRAFDDYRAVVFCQETLLARAAVRTMSVGALWYADNRRCSDATIFAALPLLDAGFPFLKRSLLTKHAEFNDINDVHTALRARTHPVDNVL
jgi:lipopolysaccharide biosynthesis protein